MKILIVEDEPSLLEIMKRFLEQELYVVEVATNADEAWQKLSLYSYECILLDIMLPDGNGLELLERLRRMQRHDSVIIISAKDSIDDKVLGLELGADDYLAKPFHLAELAARIRSLIRRNRNKGELTVQVENILLWPDKQEVYVGDNRIELNRKEYDILHYFMNRPKRLVDKTTLAEAVWGDHIDQVDNFDFVYAQIKNLRKKLTQANATAQIKAVYGFGYKLIEADE